MKTEMPDNFLAVRSFFSQVPENDSNRLSNINGMTVNIS